MAADAPTPETILIVDDEDSYRMMLRGLLEKKGFQVIEAQDGEAGLTAARNEHPDLILMDVNMPRLKGSDAVRFLKEEDATAEIPVIVVSAREDSQDLLNSFAWGASDYVRKVFHHEELLARINTHLAISRLRRELVETNHKLQAAHANLCNDLDYAGEIQRSILAARLPRAPGLEFASRYLPCSSTSGDHYSAFWLDEENLGICVADASGHGVGAAMLAVFLKGQLENIIRTDGTPQSPLRPPCEVVQLINESLCSKHFGREFISAIYGIINLKSQTFRFANAGHPYPVVLARDGTVREIETRNTVLGIFPDATYDDLTLSLDPDSTVLLYTDGLTELRRPDLQQFGIERLLHAFGMCIGLDVETMAERLMGATETFREGAALEDDLTFLLIGHTASPEDSFNN